MAEHILETRIQLRYATYQQWMNSNVILKQGEAAIAAFPNNRIIEQLSNSTPENTPPAIGIKIGDGQHYFSELPWLQAISADVYNWAKMPNKPTYTAIEISGLKSYIEANAPTMPGDGTVAPRVYQIVRGTDENINKYYLQYKESTDSENWITDTSRYIDLEKLYTLLSWINEENLTEYPNLTTLTGLQTYSILAGLSYVDNTITNQFITSVSQANGVISVTRAQPSFSNLSGVATVSQGGTGRSTLSAGEVLIGNDTNGVVSRPIAVEIATNNHLVPNYLVKQYVDNAVAGLEGAMHFIGEAAIEPKNAIDPRIPDHPMNTIQAGDVVLWEAKEYVWTGTYWRLLGDEGSYAIKGSIKDADIDADANIAQSKIANLAETFNTKVDKEQGKGLSSNDYTTEEKLKLRDIEDGAEVNVIEHIFLNGTEVPPREVNNVDKTVELNIKEFDDESRRKLGTIDEGAQINNINGITLNGTAQAPDNNKIVALTIKEFTDEYKQKLDSIDTGAQVNAIQTIYLNGIQILPDQNKRIDLSIREYPQGDAELLQAHDDKLKTIAMGAQVNVIEHIKVDNQEIFPDQNKTVSITTDPHTEHINKIESIAINGTVYPTDSEKQVNITLDQAALNLNVLEGAQIPPLSGNVKEEVDIIQKKLQLARIAVTANVSDLTQTANTYIILDCGTSDSDMHT